MIRKLLFSAATLAITAGGAFAADLPNSKGPPMFAPPPPAFTWTGPYIGGQVGYQWGTSDPFFTSKLAPGTILTGNNYSNQGVVGGGHIGFNYQVSQFVFGFEADAEGTSYKGSGVQFVCGPTCVSSTRINAEGSVRGRLGWAWDRILFYGTGGAAFASIRNTFSDPFGLDLHTFSRAGWTVGGGAEYAIDPNWSVRIEYRYTDYGQAMSFPLTNTTGGLVTEHLHERDNRVEAGFSYRFDMLAPPAPVVAKY
ncbi:MAG TPA: outer membrane protein [Methylovirgula sp.]|nr:outer membrane protein [Methylovirgula sp.]